ncbi:MAG: polysaccharide deacetylase family protein, partial [Candidatus Hydrogenedentes bacterium]|nr:polysaccharide deacetylase family protein [Candidatus Hydrogenedentota bacterium]
RPRPPSRILTYHSVGQLDHAMNVTPENFAAQMAWLAGSAAINTLDDAANAKPGVAVTLDDGYRDNLTNAVPILNRFSIPATVFIVAGKLGDLLVSDAEPWHGRLMTWDEARALSELGIEIGGHSLTHPRLSQLTAGEQRTEIIGSCRRIAEELGKPVRYFAYPYGTSADYDETSVALAREAGCTVACSNRYGFNLSGCDRFTLRRIWIDATDTLETFAAKVEGRLDVLGFLDSRIGMIARRTLNRVA